MKMIKVKTDDDTKLDVTETVDLDGKPQIEIVQYRGSPGCRDITANRREAVRLAKAILRSVATSRRRFPPRKGWP